MKPEIIILYETTAQSIIRDAVTFVMFVSLIGVGVLLDSESMQWGGLAGVFLVLSAKAGSAGKRMTIADARKYLDELEAAK